MNTKQLLKKAQVVEISKHDVNNVGKLKAIEIALNNNVATHKHVKLASGLVCRRAAQIIFNSESYTII